MSVVRYATATQLLRVVPQISTRVGAATTPVNTTDVEEVLDEVSSELSGYLVNLGLTAASVYADEEAAMLARRIVIQGAAADLLSRLAGGGSNQTSDLARDYRAAYRAALDDVMRGRLKFGALSTDTESTTGITASMLTDGDYEDPPFTLSDRL
jgi:hypothetical protein